MKHFLDLTGLTQFLANLTSKYKTKVKVGQTTISAANGKISNGKLDETDEIIEFIAGTGVDITADATNKTITVGVSASTVPTYAIVEDETPQDEYAKVYKLKKTTTGAGESGTDLVEDVGTINIPKDFVVKSATVKTATADDPSGYPEGTKYIDLEINTKTKTTSSEHLYLRLDDLVAPYEAGEGLSLNTVNGHNQFDVNISATAANGLNITNDALGITLVTASTNGEGGSNGAMLATDKEKLNILDARTFVASNNGVTVITASDGTKNVTVGAVVDTTKGLSIGSNGIEIVNGNGINFSSGAIQVQSKTDGGITVDANGVFVNNGNGLAMEGTSGSKTLNAVGNNAKAVSVDANGIGVDIDTTAGLEYSNNTIAVNNGAGIEFASGAVKVKGNTNKAIEVDATNGVGVVVNTAKGIDVDSDGVKANLTSYTQLSPATADPTTGEIAYELFPTGVNTSGQLVTKIESITTNEIDALFA